MKLLDFMHECPPGHNQLLDSSTGTAHESRLQVHCSRDCRGGLGRMLRGVTVTMPVHSVRNGKKVNMHTFKPHASNIGRDESLNTTLRLRDRKSAPRALGVFLWPPTETNYSLTERVVVTRCSCSERPRTPS